MSIRETDFMSDLHAAQEMKPHLASNIFLGSIAGFVVLFFIWAGFSQVEMLVRGQGQVVPTSEVQIVQSLEGGILQELLVAEGNGVRKKARNSPADQRCDVLIGKRGRRSSILKICVPKRPGLRRKPEILFSPCRKICRESSIDCGQRKIPFIDRGSKN